MNRVCVYTDRGDLWMSRDCETPAAASNLARVYENDGYRVDVMYQDGTETRSDDIDTAAVYLECQTEDRIRWVASNGRPKRAMLARMVLAGICTPTSLRDAYRTRKPVTEIATETANAA